jgi:hypothetical protein
MIPGKATYADALAIRINNRDKLKLKETSMKERSIESIQIIPPKINTQ